MKPDQGTPTLRLVANQFSALVCDIGGTNTRIGFVDQRGNLREVVVKKTVPKSLTNAPPAQIVDFIVGTISERAKHMAGLRRDAVVVVSICGPVQDRRTLLGAPPLLGRVAPAEVPDLQAQLGANLQGRHVELINDMSAAAWFLSRENPTTRFLAVTVSTGIGSKIYDPRHELQVLDDQPFAGEIGHFVVDHRPDAPVCACGGRGHVGALASGTALEQRARAAAGADPAAFAKSYCAFGLGANPEGLSNEQHLVPALKYGDPWTMAILIEGIRVLAQPLMATVIAAGIDRILLLGGLAQNLGQLYVDALTEALESLSGGFGFAPDMRGLIQLRDQDEQTCLLGAAAYAQRLLSRQQPPAHGSAMSTSQAPL